MPNVAVKLIYEAQEPGGFIPRKFELTKTFKFNKLPTIQSHILLRNDACEYIKFYYPIYDPETDTYYTNMETSENVERYHGNNAKEKMSKVVKRYQEHGWKCKLIEEGTAK